MHLIIVESPTKAKTISNFLGNKYLVTSSYGHVRDLPSSKLGVDVENNFQPQYVIPVKARKRVKELRQELKKTDQVILATDEDREGEAIAYHLTQILKLDKEEEYQRIVFHEITEQAIEEALKNPRKINFNLVRAQQARRILDRLVGYKLSPFLWKKVMRGLSAGRVQSVVLRVIAEREKEIKNFKAQEYWTIEVDLKKNKEEFQAFLIKQNNKKIPQPGIEKEKEARAISQDLKKAAYRVSQLEKKTTKKNPLPPFTTSTLQQTAGQRFRFSAKFTMRTAQELYERGLITYHRTDSFNLSKESLRKASEIIKNRYGQDYYPEKTNYYKTKSQSAQEAHEAIRPSYPEKDPECSEIKNKLTSPQIKIYDLIWRRFLASQMRPALLNSYKVDILAQPSESKNFSSKNKNYLLRVSGQQIKFDGFLRVYPLHLEENLLPNLKEKDELNFIKEHISQHFTQPPARYNEASLIKFLEKEGIGRPSTYAPIIDTIQKRNYVTKDEKKRFFPTEIGIMVDDIIREHFPEIVDVKFTSQLENKLDQIAAGQEKWDKVLSDFYQPFEKNLENKYQEVPKKEFTEKTDKICPKCGKPLVIKRSRFGKFYSCSNFPECDYKESLPRPDLGINCPKCKKGKIVEKRTRKGKIFYGCDQWPRCDFALWDKPTGEHCPLCGSLLVRTKNKKIKCSNKDCPYGKK